MNLGNLWARGIPAQEILSTNEILVPISDTLINAYPVYVIVGALNQT